MQTTKLHRNAIPVFAHWFGSWQISVQRRAYDADELTRYYDREAPSWNMTVENLGFARAYESLFRKLFQRGRTDVEQGPLRVLDAGVGTGALSLALNKVVDQPTMLDGVDLSDQMLNRARHTLSQTSFRVSLERGDVTELPYEDGVFDVVMTAHVLEHLPDPQTALREMIRVLKPGGLLIACITRRSPLGAYIQWKWHTHRVSPDEGKRWLRYCGLLAVRARPFEKGTTCRRMSVAYTGRKPINSTHDMMETNRWS